MNVQGIRLRPHTHEDGRAVLLMDTWAEDEPGPRVVLTAGDATDLMASLAIWLASHDEVTKPRERLTDVIDEEENESAHRPHPGQSCAEAHG